MSKPERILVIKLGALGDLVLCMGAFEAIRKAHPNAEIAILTGPAFAPFVKEMPWFDTVLTDSRPRFTQLGKWWKLLSDVRSYAPTRVYDFQGKFRQSILYHVLRALTKGVEWSGAIEGCSHPRAWPPSPNMHYSEFVAAQLKAAGLDVVKEPDMSWLDEPLTQIELPEKYAVFVPGCAPQHVHKRWPAKSYAKLAKTLEQNGTKVLAIGTKADADSISAICDLAPNVIDMAGKTNLKQLARVFRGADVVIGNDTGPTHLAAAVGAHTVALMSDKVDPYWSSPKGVHTTWLQGRPLSKLAVSKVEDAVGLTS